MSRSGYSDECDGWRLICWRGAVASALRGKRGQAFLRETLAALDAMPAKELAANSFVEDGQYCTLGVVGAARGLGLSNLGEWDREDIAAHFKVAEALAAEVMYENDEGGRRNETPAQRWARMRAWVVENIRADGAPLLEEKT